MRNAPHVTDICPLQIAAIGMRHGGRVFLKDNKLQIQEDLDLRCIGPACMVFVPTGTHPETGAPVGGCGPAVAAVQAFKANQAVERLVQLVTRRLAREPWHVRLRAWLREKWNGLGDGLRKPVAAPVPLRAVDTESETPLPPT
jgi:hypothetical protein